MKKSVLDFTAELTMVRNVMKGYPNSLEVKTANIDPTERKQVHRGRGMGKQCCGSPVAKNPSGRPG